MVITSTPYISYQEINVDNADLFDDAWGFNSEFADVISFLGTIDSNPGEHLTKRVLAKIGRNE